MKRLLPVTLALCGTLSSLRAEVYAPTAKIGEFLKAFAQAYGKGDGEWMRSAVDREGIVQEAEAAYFGLLGPREGGEAITDLRVKAAPDGYTLSNSLLDFEILPTISVDFIIVFQRGDTTIRVPAGYRDGQIRLAGLKRK